MGKLYTGNGDTGYTQTLKNRRISKADSLIELLGTVDEFSSFLGAAKACSYDKILTEDIELIQKKLISIMGEIQGGELSVTEECVSALEKMCDKYLPEGISEFSLSGKNPLSAQLHIARTVIRRAERVAVKMSQTGRIGKNLLTYINRLGDAVYAMACYAEREKTSISEGAEDSRELTLSLAKEIALAVEMRAKELGIRIVTAITDRGANLVLLHSMNDAYIASSQIAQDKAYTSAALKMPTHIALKESRGGKLDGLCVTDSNKISLLGGGYPLLIEGRLVGGVGVSGGTAEEDTHLAEFAAKYLERRFSI